ncbi:MAG: hypothetical protein AABZ39_16565 [Spirochaetota bacterium]
MPRVDALFGSFRTAVTFAFAAATLSAVPAEWKDIPFVETAPAVAPDAEERARGFVLFTRPITEPVYRETRPLADERLTVFSVMAAQGEYETVILGIHPLKAVSGISVSVSPLAGPTTIPSSAVDARMVKYEEMRYPMYTTKGTYRRVPELLYPFAAIDASEGVTEQVWITIAIPQTAAPGVYTAQVNVAAEGGVSVSIPLRVRVLAFALRSDPAKFYSTYSYDIHFRARNSLAAIDPALTNKEGLDRIALDDFRTMIAYGMNIPSTGWYSYDTKTSGFYYRGVETFDILRRAGFTNIPFYFAIIGNGIAGLYQKYTGSWIPGHALVTNMPPDAFFDEVTEKVKKIEAERIASNWPPFYYNPLDEVDAAATEFGVRVHAAVKKAGVRTYATKDPKSPDAPAYRDVVDLWCAQTYSVPYEEVRATPNKRFWTYPNHNAGEIKIREAMFKGGRLTYGYGFWKSGYEGIVPWIWHWDVEDPANYLDGNYADTGPKIARDGAILPATYWVCFREGADDARYIYTLAEAIAFHEKEKDPSCAALVKEGKAFLKKIWDGTPRVEKYLGTERFCTADFFGYRLNMARLITSLSKFPSAPVKFFSEPNETKSPVFTAPSAFEIAAKQGLLETYDLGDDDFSMWVNLIKEGVMEVADDIVHAGKKSLRWTVTIDHINDGGEGGKYPKGWPRMKINLPTPIDLNEYDYFSMWFRVDSNRDEVADDRTPFSMDLYTASGKYQKYHIVNETEQRIWRRILIPVSEFATLVLGTQNLKVLNGIQLWVNESEYAHGTRLVFHLDEVSFVRFKEPVIDFADIPGYAAAGDTVPVIYSLLGEASVKQGECRVRASLLDAAKAMVVFAEQDLKAYRRLALPLTSVQTGPHRVSLEILRGSRVVSSVTSDMAIIAGPFGR